MRRLRLAPKHRAITKEEFMEIIEHCDDEMEIKINTGHGCEEIRFVSIRVDVVTKERFIEVE